jgi:prepilin-type N-terminal cleavage/methylation domain-containing protein
MQCNEGKTSWRQGFTLIELLVVIGIIVILMLVAIPALNSIFNNASLTMAENQLRASIAQARSLAIRDRRMVGLVFFEPDATLDKTVFKDRATHGDRTAYQVIVYDHADPGVDYFTPQVNSQATEGFGDPTIYRSPEYLPRGLRVGVIDDSPGYPLRTEFSPDTVKARVIMFDASGQLVMRNRMAGGNGSRTEWYLRGDVAASQGVSSPGFTIYDTNKLRNSVDISNSARISDWIFRNANMYVINAYTGGIVR